MRLSVTGLGGSLTCTGFDNPYSSRICPLMLAEGEMINLIGDNTTAFAVIQSASGQTCGASSFSSGPLTVENNLRIRATGADG